MQELRSRGVSQKHIDAALSTAFGDTRQLPTSEPGSEAEEREWFAKHMCAVHASMNARRSCCTAVVGEKLPHWSAGYVWLIALNIVGGAVACCQQNGATFKHQLPELA